MTKARETMEKSLQARSLRVQYIQPTENTNTIFDLPVCAGIPPSLRRALGQNLARSAAVSVELCWLHSPSLTRTGIVSQVHCLLIIK